MLQKRALNASVMY